MTTALETGGSSSDLDRLIVLASTFREASTERREALAHEIAPIEAGFAESVILHTCHRVELIGVADAAPSAPDGMRLLRGAAAVERVLLVAGGFDSAVVAEEQLIGQIRDAYQAALARGATGPILNELLRRAIRLGRRVRSEATPGADRSLADRAVAWALARLAAGPERGGSALVAGSGEMGRIMAERLATAGMEVTIASRSLERARRIAERLPAAGREAVFPQALTTTGPHRVVALALRDAPGLLGEAMLGDARPLVIDLSSPSAIDPAFARQLGDRLLDLDGVGREARSPLSPQAERRLRSEVVTERDRFLAWLATRASQDAIVALRRHADDVRRHHVERLARRGELSEEQLHAIDAMTASLVAELLHVPTTHAADGGRAAELIRELYGLGQ